MCGGFGRVQTVGAVSFFFSSGPVLYICILFVPQFWCSRLTKQAAVVVLQLYSRVLVAVHQLR